MLPIQPDLKDSFIYGGQKIAVDWFDVLEKSKLPDLPWEQVYAIGFLDGKIPIVLYEDDHSNLPGGKLEPKETVEQALHREILEELNCEVIDWQPLGYQKNTEPSGGVVYQLRVVCRLKKRNEFAHDPGGSVVGYKLVELDKLNDAINYGKVGKRMIELIKYDHS